MAKVKHIAFFKFKAETTPEQVDSLFDLLLEVTEVIPGIEDYVSGTNNSPEGLANGFTHALVMTFTDAAARDAYLPHAEHQRFIQAATPHIEAVTVVDFEV